MTHRGGAVWTERLFLALILASLAGTLNLVLTMHRRVATSNSTSVLPLHELSPSASVPANTNDRRDRFILSISRQAGQSHCGPASAGTAAGRTGGRSHDQGAGWSDSSDEGGDRGGSGGGSAHGEAGNGKEGRGCRIRAMETARAPGQAAGRQAVATSRSARTGRLGTGRGTRRAGARARRTQGRAHQGGPALGEFHLALQGTQWHLATADRHRVRR